MTKNALHRIMDEHFEQIEKEHPECCFKYLPELDYENNEMIYHCLRDWGLDEQEINRLCKPENREECDKILMEGL